MSSKPPRHRLPAPATLPPVSAPGPDHPAYWKSRVVRQRYTGPARPGSENELFAQLEHDGKPVYFPLETHHPDRAAERAGELYRLSVTEGWSALRQRQVRQIIWAVYWFAEPLACTYATLFTRLEATPAAAPPSDPKVSVALLEPDPEVRRSLEHCLNEMPHHGCIRAAGRAAELLAPGAAPPRLVLFNRDSPGAGEGEFPRRLHDRWPAAVALPFDVFGHSDELFTGSTGMDRGYFLRRRTHAQILEPLERHWLSPSAEPAAARSQAQAYFRKLITAEPPSSAAPRPALTHREAQILAYLGAGHTNKTIAKLLGISAWTVHTYVKNIFEKLGVHTRAEAVMRCPDPLNR